MASAADGAAAADAPLVDCPEGLTALGWALIATSAVFLVLFILCVLFRQQRGDPLGTDSFGLWLKRLCCGGSPTLEAATPRRDNASEKASARSPYYDSSPRQHWRQPSHDMLPSPVHSGRRTPGYSPSAYAPSPTVYSQAGRSFRSRY